MSRRNRQRHQLQAPGQIPRRRVMHSACWRLSTAIGERVGRARRTLQGARFDDGATKLAGGERENAETDTREEHTFRANYRFSSRRYKMRDVRGETITLAFFETAIRRGELRRALFPLGILLAPLPRDGFPHDGKARHTRLEGCEKRLRAITVVIARSGKVHQKLVLRARCP